MSGPKKNKTSTRTPLTVEVYEDLGDEHDVMDLLGRGIRADATTLAARDGFARAPFWAAACRAGPQALDVLLAAGCRFLPATSQADPTRHTVLLTFALSHGPSRADWVLDAFERGALDPGSLGAPNDAWEALHQLVARMDLARDMGESQRSFVSIIAAQLGGPTPSSAADDDGDGDGYSEALDDDELRAHPSCSAWRERFADKLEAAVGPCPESALAELAPRGMFWALERHLAQKPCSLVLAHSICEGRLPWPGRSDPFRSGRSDLASARTAGALLLPSSPVLDLALDARTAAPSRIAFALAAGASHAQASDEPLCSLCAAVFGAESEDFHDSTPLSYLIHPMLSAVGQAPKTTAHYPESAFVLAAAGCSALAPGRLGVSALQMARAHLQQKSSTRRRAHTFFGGLIGLAPSGRAAGYDPPSKSLADAIELIALREELELAARAPQSAAPPRSKSL